MKSDAPHYGKQSLRLLTYNIQVGIETRAFHHYLTGGWRHILPCPTRRSNLDRTVRILHGFDLVALQETDGGSLRSGNINQVEYLAQKADFPFWWMRVNRRLGRFATHSMGLLSRYRPREIHELPLPGRIPGRGAILARFGEGKESLLVIVAHLSLGRRSRGQQLSYLRKLIGAESHVVLMGDLNCTSEQLMRDPALQETNLSASPEALASYPSWRPRRNLDHILVSPSLRVEHTQVLHHHTVSDHLPLAMELSLPKSVNLDAPPAWAPALAHQ